MQIRVCYLRVQNVMSQRFKGLCTCCNCANAFPAIVFNTYVVQDHMMESRLRYYLMLRLVQRSSFQTAFHQSLDSSVGRAGDCRGIVQTSLGHWFESGSRDNFFGLTPSIGAYQFWTLRA